MLNKLKSFGSIMLAIFVGFLIGAIVLAFAGYNPIQVYTVLFGGIFSRPKSMVQVVIQATPLIITALSVVFAFKTGLFNIGAEGQFMMGALVASFLGYMLRLPIFIHPLVVMLGAMLAGGIYGGFVGLLKAKYGIHEVITSIMFNWIALYINNFYVSSSGLKKPNSEAVYEIQKTAYINVLQTWKDNPDKVAILNKIPVWGELILKTDINYGIIIAIICAIVVWFIINKTTLGYSLKAVGFNKDAAEFAGIDIKKSMFMSMAISGAIAGLAGAVYITGMNPHRIGTLSLHENYGFNGLSIALISAINPIACIFGGLFYGCLKFGGTLVQSQLRTPTEIINIMIGVIVYFISIKSIVSIASDKLKLIKRPSRKGGLE